jgi:hypothetical protein
MKHLRDIALVSAATICGPNSAANAEKWSCEMEMSTKGKTYKQEWIVSGDKMFANSKAKGYRVVLNNSDTLFAFFRLWSNDPKDRTPTNFYVLVAKSTGVVTEFDDLPADYNFGPNPDQWSSPAVTVGHCSLVQH